MLWLFDNDHSSLIVTTTISILCQCGLGHTVSFRIIIFRRSNLLRVHLSHVKWCVSIWLSYSFSLCELSSVSHSSKICALSSGWRMWLFCHCLFHLIIILGSNVGSRRVLKRSIVCPRDRGLSSVRVTLGRFHNSGCVISGCLKCSRNWDCRCSVIVFRNAFDSVSQCIWLLFTTAYLGVYWRLGLGFCSWFCTIVIL